MSVRAPKHTSPLTPFVAGASGIQPLSALGARIGLMSGGGQCGVAVDWRVPQRVVSWAIHNGGMRESRSALILQIDNHELSPDRDPRALARDRAEAAGRGDGVALLTSANVSNAGFHFAEQADVGAAAVATVGLSNALRVGDPPTAGRAGTINLICWVNVPLSSEALLEAASLAVAARTLVVLEAAVRSTVSDGLATGTGTDCVVLACPARGEAAALPYAGMHTAVGSVVGRAVVGAVSASLERGITARR